MSLTARDRYLAAVQTLFSINMGLTPKLGLSNIRQLCAYFGNPQDDLKVIHVAGTNGKGSVATKCAAALSSAGYRTGLFTSPHIFSFRERMRVNHTPIPTSAVSDILDEILASKLPATFFEVITMMSFLHFKRSEVDWTVLEVGLGGRLDATNVVTPAISVITSIDYDH
jgi:dihydrofolate synthase/folylpolyglutamate synthase